MLAILDLTTNYQFICCKSKVVISLNFQIFTQVFKMTFTVMAGNCLSMSVCKPLLNA